MRVQKLFLPYKVPEKGGQEKEIVEKQKKKLKLNNWRSPARTH